jgi:Lar family restriction alleviation protein
MIKRYKCEIFGNNGVIYEACDAAKVAELENQVELLRELLGKPELAPCPFCGGSAYIEDYDVPLGGEHHVSMYAAKCYMCATCQPPQQSRAMATDAWNNRHQVNRRDT